MNRKWYTKRRKVHEAFRRRNNEYHRYLDQFSSTELANGIKHLSEYKRLYHKNYRADQAMCRFHGYE